MVLDNCIGYLNNESMDLGNMDGYIGNVGMELGKYEVKFCNLVVEFNNLIRYNKLGINYVELKDNLCRLRTF